MTLPNRSAYLEWVSDGDNSPGQTSRRVILGAMASLPALAGSGGTAFGQAASSQEPGSEPRTHPLTVRQGEELAGGARLSQVHGLHFGAVALVVELASGDKFQVDVHARSLDGEGPVPIGQTDTLALFVSNLGDGAKRTTEARGLAVMSLAQRLFGTSSSGLLTFEQRQREYGNASLDLPLSVA